MTSVSLSTRDINVLEKIRDPEFDPSSGARISPAAPVDPHITDTATYQQVVKRERAIISQLQQAESGLEESQEKSALDSTAETYAKAVAELGELIDSYPSYASARNNRAQALRRLHGDGMLVSELEPRSPSSSATPTQSLVRSIGEEEQRKVSGVALADLDRAIGLLTPPTPWAMISPVAAKTLSLAHTQRAALYHASSKLLADGDKKACLRLGHDRREVKWNALEFETAASKDFALGGKYGNEIAKGLAVSTNPTAKLCGQMVQEMMRREFGDDGR